MFDFFKNTKISIKLLISSILFFLPIAILFFFFLTGINSSIRFSALETYGNKLQRPLEELLTFVPTYFRLEADSLPSALAKKEDLKHKIDLSLKKLEALNQDYSTDLQLTSEELGKKGKNNLIIVNMIAKWKSLSESGGDPSGFIQDIKDSIEYIGNSSNLILDPDLDTYYTMDFTLLALPQTQGRIAEIEDYADQLLLKVKLEEQDRIKFAVYAAQLEESDYSRILKSTEVAIKEDQNFYGIDPVFQAQMPKALENYKTETLPFIEALHKLSDPAVSPIGKDRFSTLGEAADNAAFSYWSVASDNLDNLLHTRIASYETTRLIGTILTLISIVIALLLIFLISKSITISIHKTRNYAEKIAQGDLVIKNPIEQKDEIGSIGTNLRILQENLREILKNEIRSTVQVLTQSTLQLTSTNQQISTTGNQQAAAVKEIVTTMEDSDRLSKGIAEKITNVTELSENSRNRVNSGFEIVNTNKSTMEEIKSRNDETIEGIKTLAAKIENIQGIVNIINSFANQTKIIAFNAELEASSAGPAGKNFEIVATEIRRLADNTGTSTNEIRGIINEIQKASETLLIRSRSGTEKIIEGLGLSSHLNELFQDILGTVDLSAGSSIQIATLIKQQVQAFEQILLTLKQISEGIDAFVVSTKGTTKASEDIQQITRDLEATLAKFSLD